MKLPTDSKRRTCYKAEEHTQHIVASCTTLTPSDYTDRHNNDGGYIHWTVCKHLRLQAADKYYVHITDRSII